MLDFETVVLPVIEKYSGKPQNEWSDIIAQESKRLFQDKTMEELVEIYNECNHQWLILPEITRRRASSPRQLMLFAPDYSKT